jgi:hypothetical protein
MVPLLFKKISLNSRFSEKGHEKNYCLGSSSFKKIPPTVFSHSREIYGFLVETLKPYS